MKKTYNINLGGIVFHIDEDAYELLDKYLSNLRIHFSKEEGAEEIVHDMELRISELFSERLNEKNQVITLKDVEEIIAQMGKPEEFSEDATQDTNEYIKDFGVSHFLERCFHYQGDCPVLHHRLDYHSRSEYCHR